LIPVQATEQIVDALNDAVELEGDCEARVEFLLHRLQALLNRPARCALWLIEELARRPAPRITYRAVVRPILDEGVLATLEMAQQALDAAGPISEVMVRGVLDHIRSPVTIIASSVGSPKWFQSAIVDRYLQQLGCIDCITSMWASTADRAISLICHRREMDPPFSENDSTLVSLMLRAVAPIVDRDLFRSMPPVSLKDLSQREREVLLMLLAGDSEKEIAATLHRSVHTVHSFVSRLHAHFNVSSRGELMALFVDKAVVASIRQNLPA
jgi:DNA-binding CsgD family transcriptional regulator